MQPRKNSLVAGLQTPPATGRPLSTIATEMQNSGIRATKFARAIERINNPHPAFLQPGKIIGTFLRDPTFSSSQKPLTKHIVHHSVRLCDWVACRFVFRHNRTVRKNGPGPYRPLPARLEYAAGFPVVKEGSCREPTIYTPGVHFGSPFTPMNPCCSR
jgi:hypothetical protein